MVRETDINADQHINVENRFRPDEPTKVEEFLEAVAASLDFNWGHVTDVSFNDSTDSSSRMFDEYVIHLNMTPRMSLNYSGIVNMAHEGYTIVKTDNNKTDDSSIDRVSFVKFSDIVGDDRHQPDSATIRDRFDCLGL